MKRFSPMTLWFSLLFPVAPVLARDPIPELARLNAFEGEWEVRGTTWANVDGESRKVELAGSMTCEWVLKKTWLQMTQTEQAGGQSHIHLSLITWDPVQKAYFRRVFTHTSARHPREEGRWAAENVFEFTSEFDWDDGNRYGFRNVFEFVSDSEIRLSLHQNTNDGDYFKRTEAVMTKK